MSELLLKDEILLWLGVYLYFSPVFDLELEASPCFKSNLYKTKYRETYEYNQNQILFL